MKRGFTCSEDWKVDKYFQKCFQPAKLTASAKPLSVAKFGDSQNGITYSDQFATWLDSLSFDYFCTFTTPYELTIPSARRAMEGLFNTLEKDFLPVNSSQYVADPRNDLKMFFATEPFDVKEGHHTHALIRYQKFLPHIHERNFSSPTAYKNYLSTQSTELDHRLTIFNTWQYVTGSKGRLINNSAPTMCKQEQNKISVTGKFHRADVKKIDPTRRASSYCSKYILKTRADYDLLFLKR